MKAQIRPLVWWLSLLVFSCTQAFSANTVRTISGEINGLTVFYNGIPVSAYLGIPYVKPPVGELRFKKPVPIEPWHTPLEAISLSPRCTQYVENPYPWLDLSPGMSEDCLHLNVWVPPTASTLKNKKTVMFWISEGGFAVRGSGMDFYQGQALAVEGDVIVVSINHRLGAFGFFYSATEDAPGNVGMYDIVEALKWTRDNIEFFGGDKDSITLFGDSAGGIAIGMLTVSPLARGLFKRAIMQSGNPTSLDGEDNDMSFRVSKKLAKAVGCANYETTLEADPEAVLDCMRGVDATELATKLIEVAENSYRPVYPRFGDELLPKNPRQAVIDGDFDPIDLLIGSTKGDGSLILTVKMKDVCGLFGEKYPQINHTFGESIIRSSFKSYPDPEAVVRQYLANVGEEDYDEIRFQVFNAIGDYARICPSVYFAESFAAINANVYYYLFTHIPSNSLWAPWMLSVHHDDVPFVFGYPLRYPQNYTLSEQALSRDMIHAWSSFAKTGRPELGIWPQYSKELPIYKALDTDMSIGYGPHRDNCDFFRSAFGF